MRLDLSEKPTHPLRSTSGTSLPVGSGGSSPPTLPVVPSGVLESLVCKRNVPPPVVHSPGQTCPDLVGLIMPVPQTARGDIAKIRLFLKINISLKKTWIKTFDFIIMKTLM